MALRQDISELACTLVSLFRTRLELFSLEASAQKTQLVSLLIFTLGSVLFLTLAILVLSLTVALFFWPTEHRYLALGLLALIYAVMGVVMLLVVRSKLKSAAMPFTATLDELHRDWALMKRLREPADAFTARDRGDSE